MVSTLGENGAGSWMGVALSRTEIVAYDSRLKSAGSAVWRMPLEPPAADQLSWPSLATALRTLKQLTRENNGHLAVALMPPVSEVRRVDVPPLADDEIEAVLSRSASKYFVGAQGAQLVGVTTNRPANVAGAVAAATPAWIVRQITLAARESGWKLEHISPAEAAWASAIARGWPAAANGDAQLLVHQAEHTHALAVANGSITAVRRYRSATVDVPLFLESQTTQARVLAIGEPTVRKQWIAALGEKALSVSLPANIPTEVANDAALLAAACVVDVQTLVFRTDEMRAADRKRRDTVMYSLFGAAVVILALAGGFTMSDVQRELAAVQAARAEIKPQLATTLLGRTSVETVSGQLQFLATNERASAQWSVVIADLTKHLPDEAHLTAFRGWSDSVRFEGLADRAASVFPTLTQAESFGGVKAAAAVRLEAMVDGSSLERFTLVGKLKPRVVAAVTVPDSTGKPARAGAAKGAP